MKSQPTPPADLPRFLTLDEAVAILGVDKGELRERCLKGEIEGAVKPLGKWLIRESAVEEMRRAGIREQGAT